MEVDYEDSKGVDGALRGVDVFVSVLSSYVSQTANVNIVDALAKNRVRVYIPSEFGL